MLTINSLPYIDGTPDSDQERIEWVKNGEKTLGSSTRYGSDGVLNRVGNQLNSNIQFLYTTAQSIASALNQNTNDISVIKTSLNISSNTNLINDVQNAKIQIASLTDENTSVKSELSDLSTSAKSLSANIGVKDLTDTSTRSVFQDLLWIKTELGNYASQDFNGQPVNDLSPSGLKGKYWAGRREHGRDRAKQKGFHRRILECRARHPPGGCLVAVDCTAPTRLA